VGGRTYYSGHSPYSYQYARGSYVDGAAIMIVSRSSYGCYSCYSRTCSSCSGCTTRTDCNAYDTAYVISDQDRYVLELPSGSLLAPPEGSPAWPLTLTIYNATQFSTSAETENAIYLSFTTAAGDSMENILDNLGWSWYLLFAMAIFLCFELDQRRRHRLFAQVKVERKAYQKKFDIELLSPMESPRVLATSAHVQPVAVAQPMAQPVQQPAMAVQQVPMAMAMPQQQALCGQIATVSTTTTTVGGAQPMGGGGFFNFCQGGVPMAQPQGAVPMAQPVGASPPTSPPMSPPNTNKDD
jgi:hypothetical protein